jgi:zinc transport system ATP-binding protein
VTEPPLLEIAHLGVRRGENVLLEDVTLPVAAGSIHVVVGPNGAGKSTLVAAILGQTAFTGSIRFHWRGTGRIGFVPQAFAVDRTLPVTVIEFLALLRQKRPICLGPDAPTTRRCEALLARVGLGPLGRRPLGVLSGGELRRVLVANALDPAPEFLLLDEPGSGLDAASLTVLDELLVGLRAAGGTVLMVSHDLDQVRRVADQVTLLARTVRRTGTADEVLAAHPHALYAQGGPP